MASAKDQFSGREERFEAMMQRERLHFAAGAGDLAAVEKWLAAGYRVNRYDSLGKTPLHYAVGKNHVAVVCRLIRAGANVNAHDERQAGNTPLSDNIETMTFDMVQRLLLAGGDPRIRGWMQLSAIDRAERRTDSDARKILRALREAEKRLNG